MTFQEWEAKGKRLFGDDLLTWRFVCPSCGHVQSLQDFKDLEIDPNHAYGTMCIGRVDGAHHNVPIGTKPGPCNYHSGGLLNLNPIRVEHPDTGKPVRLFAFDESQVQP